MPCIIIGEGVRECRKFLHRERFDRTNEDVPLSKT
jgi:hypothetical protein